MNALDLALTVRYMYNPFAATQIQWYEDLRYTVMCNPFQFLVKKMREKQFLKGHIFVY